MLRIALVTFALAACGKGNPSEPAPPPVQGPPKAPVDGIELVNPGNEPRRQLRYTPKKGATTKLEVASDADVASPGRDKKLATLVLAAEVIIDDVLADGSAKVRTKIVGATARERKDANVSVAQMSEFVQIFNGVTIRYSLSAAGNLTGTTVDAGREMPKAMADQLDSVGKNFESAAMALPEVPVGVGAVWRYRKTISQVGIPSTTVTTIELVGIDGDRISFKTSTKASGKDQQVAQPDGSSVDVRDVRGGGTGSGTYDLSRVVMSGSVSSEFHVVMNGLELKMASSSKMTVQD